MLVSQHEPQKGPTLQLSLVNIIIYTCAFPATASHVCCEKDLLQLHSTRGNY